MDPNTREIECITFGIYSPEEVMKMSVCKVDSVKKIVGTGTVYDPRMGTTDSSHRCETCKGDAKDCPGHFGRIELNEPVIHPLFYKRVGAFLNCFCMKCCRLVIQKDQLFLSGLNKFKGEARFTRILEKLKKIDMCCQPTGDLDDNGEQILCGKEKPKIKFITADSSYQMIYSEKKEKTSIVLTTEEIKKVFDNIPAEDVVTLGFDPRLTHPRNFIITVLPVLPPADRPYVKADNKMCDDDLTNQYCEIIKANNNLLDENDEDDEENKGKSRKKDNKETIRQRAIASLKFRILTTFNNGQGKAKHTTNGRPIKGIKERLTGKEGQIRSNMMGKRCDYTARTVIGPDPSLRVGELGVPEELAKTLSKPEVVTSFNINILQKLVDDGKIKTLTKPDGVTVIDLKRFRRGTRLLNGDIIYRGDKQIPVVNGRELVLEGDKVLRNGEFIDKIKYSNRSYSLTNGWIVHRPLQDDDYVLLNRQPTLHMASMLAMRVKIKPHKTLRFNLASTKGFNADFDGDRLCDHNRSQEM